MIHAETMEFGRAVSTRRGFVSGAISAAGLTVAGMRPWYAFADGMKPTQPCCATPKLRFGVVSDVHVRTETGPYGTETLLKAFEWFRDQGVDGVVIAGDMADHGLIAQLQYVADAWERAFPNGRGLGGKPVEKLFIYGNHDIEGFKYPKAKPAPEETIVADRAAAWERVFKEPYAPIWRKTVKGYTFIGAHWDSWKGVPAIEPYMKEHAAELRGNRPFFYIQHPHPKETCHGPWAWGRDDGFAGRSLSPFPNAVAFSGHSHHPLTDERSIWQGAFTSIGTASLRYIDPIYGRENAGPHALDDLKQMPFVNQYDGRQGMLVSVYGDRIVVERRAFLHDGKLGPDWVIPLSAAKGRPFSFKARAERAVAPQFPAGAEVAVTGPADGKDRKGRTVKQLTVTFPAALHGEGQTRAYDYEVVAEAEECDVRRVVCTKRVYSPAYFLPPAQEPEMVSCVFSLSELNTRKGPYFSPTVRFTIRAAETFGKASAPLLSAAVRL